MARLWSTKMRLLKTQHSSFLTFAPRAAQPITGMGEACKYADWSDFKQSLRAAWKSYQLSYNSR